MLVGSSLAGLIVVWQSVRPETGSSSIQQLTELASAFATAILAVELALALFSVPAATAGAICQEKMRGELALMMVSRAVLSDTLGLPRRGCRGRLLQQVDNQVSDVSLPQASGQPDGHDRGAAGTDLAEYAFPAKYPPLAPCVIWRFAFVLLVSHIARPSFATPVAQPPASQ